VYEELKRRKILVATQTPGAGGWLRISIGSEGEIGKLIKELRNIEAKD